MISRRFVVLLVGFVGLLVPAGARATFSGRDGLIAVQPLRGPGLVLVSPGSGQARRLCPRDLVCGRATAPSWSVDGRLVAFGLRMRGGGVEAMYPDGSCFTCVGGPARPTEADVSRVAFTDRPFELAFAGAYSVDDGYDVNPFLDVGNVGALDFSLTGRIALSRDGIVFVARNGLSDDRLGELQRVARGGAPSWSPTGRRLTFADRGWVLVLRPGSPPRRLVWGSAPVFSPDGRQIAFFDREHHLRRIAVSGGRSRRVGEITGTRAAWQPLPRAAPVAGGACAPTDGETVLSSSPTTTISRLGYAGDGTLIGCAVADGEPRMIGLVGSYGGEDPTNVDAIATSTSGDVAAVAEDTFDHEDFDATTTSTAVNLLTGLTPADATRIDIDGTVAALAVNNAGGQAEITSGACPGTPPIYEADCVIAADADGIKTAADAQPDPGSTATDPFADLAITTTNVSWTDNGAPRTAQLP